jgi:hypothetical protein
MVNRSRTLTEKSLHFVYTFFTSLPPHRLQNLGWELPEIAAHSASNATPEVLLATVFISQMVLS